MSSAVNHRKRSHRSEAAHYHACRTMKGSAPRITGLYGARRGLGIVAALRALARRYKRESRSKTEP